MDEFSWTLSHDGVIYHNQQEVYKMGSADAESKSHIPQEGDVIGISYDHIQLKFYVNGEEVEYAVTNVKGTVCPALYGKHYSVQISFSFGNDFVIVDDGAILDIVLENFSHSPPSGFEKIMVEQSLL